MVIATRANVEILGSTFPFSILLKAPLDKPAIRHTLS